MDVVENTDKNEEKAEVLNAVFASVFSSKNSCSLRSQPPGMGGDRGREQNEALRIQGETFSDLLHHLDRHKSLALNGC